MAARTLPTLPTFTANATLTSAQLNQLVNYVAYMANVPSFRMYQTVAQSIPNTTDTQITMDTPDYDSDSGRSLTSPWSYTVPFAGRWNFTVNASFSANATGDRQAKLFKNGTVVTGGEAGDQAAATPGNSNGFVSVTILCAVGDVIGAYCWHSAGAALNTQIGAPCSTFEGRLVSFANP